MFKSPPVIAANRAVIAERSPIAGALGPIFVMPPSGDR